MNYNKIKDLADQRKIKIIELSEKIGLSKTGLYKTISNKSMKVDTLEAIAKELNVSITQFFDDVMTVWEEHNAEYLSEISRLREENEKLSKQLEEFAFQKRIMSNWQLRINFYRDFRVLFEQTKSKLVKKKLSKEEGHMLFVLEEFSHFLKEVVEGNVLRKDETTKDLLDRLMIIMGYKNDFRALMSADLTNESVNNNDLISK
jgi:transcriptional regulator with XRE-family HTH domain